MYKRKLLSLIHGSYYHSLGLDNRGQVWSWGRNDQGQLGINSTTAKSTPVSILGNKKTFCQISGGVKYSLGLDKNNLVWGWGVNYRGNIGNNSMVSKRTPVSILGTRKTFCQIIATGYYSLGLDKNGSVWGWGSNYRGQLGINSTASYSTPVSIHGIKKTFCQIGGLSYNYDYGSSSGIDYTGQVWTWGYNDKGQLGINSTTNKSTPVSILGAKKTFCQIVNGESRHYLAIDYKGQVWGWGYGAQGALGINSTTAKSTPVSILGNKKTFCQIDCGNLYSLAIDYMGQVWSWGYNQYGQLGINSTTAKSTPVSILGNKKTFCQINCGYYHSLAIDYKGQVWGWGNNTYGKLGDNSVVSKRTPVMLYQIRDWFPSTALILIKTPT